MAFGMWILHKLLRCFHSAKSVVSTKLQSQGFANDTSLPKGANQRPTTVVLQLDCHPTPYTAECSAELCRCWERFNVDR